MKSAIRVSGVYLSMMSSLAAVILLIGTSNLPVRADIPGWATAAASVKYDITSSNWNYGPAILADHGGNYDSTGPNSIYCSVNYGGGQHMAGNASYDQQFTWGGAPLQSVNNLVLNLTCSVSAVVTRVGQTAHAKASVHPDPNVTINPVEVNGLLADAPDGDSQSSSCQFTVVSTTGNTITLTSVLEVDVSSP